MSGRLTYFIDRAWASRRRVVSTLAQDSRRSFWAMVDQGVVSCGNFGVAILLARYFAQQQNLGEYGTFGLFMEWMLLLNSGQAALTGYPLTVRGATAGDPELRRLTEYCVLLTVLAWPIMAASLLIMALVARTSIPGAIWSAVALLLWQIQETLRRGLLSHLRFREAAIGDAVSYLGQVAVVAILASRHTLTLSTAFETIALTSAMAAVLQAMQLGLRRVRLRGLRRFAADCWSLGRWVLFGNLTNFFNGTLFNWSIAWFAGFKTLGVYYAMLNLLRLANPLAIVVTTLITPATAAARSVHRAKLLTLRFTLIGAALLSPYLLTLIFFPHRCIALAYGWESEFLSYASGVQIFAVAVGLVYIAGVCGALLNGLERSRLTFIGQLIYAGGFLFIAIPLTAMYGLSGAAWGWLIAAALRAAVNMHFTLTLPSSESSQPDDAPDTNDSELPPMPLTAS